MTFHKQTARLPGMKAFLQYNSLLITKRRRQKGNERRRVDARAPLRVAAPFPMFVSLSQSQCPLKANSARPFCWHVMNSRQPLFSLNSFLILRKSFDIYTICKCVYVSYMYIVGCSLKFVYYFGPTST